MIKKHPMGWAQLVTKGARWCRVSLLRVPRTEIDGSQGVWEGGSSCCGHRARISSSTNLRLLKPPPPSRRIRAQLAPC